MAYGSKESRYIVVVGDCFSLVCCPLFTSRYRLAADKATRPRGGGGGPSAGLVGVSQSSVGFTVPVSWAPVCAVLPWRPPPQAHVWWIPPIASALF